MWWSRPPADVERLWWVVATVVLTGVAMFAVGLAVTGHPLAPIAGVIGVALVLMGLGLIGQAYVRPRWMGFRDEVIAWRRNLGVVMTVVGVVLLVIGALST